MPSVNAEKVYQLADELGELRAQELKSRVHSIVQVRETLTPSQTGTSCCCGEGTVCRSGRRKRERRIVHVGSKDTIVTRIDLCGARSGLRESGIGLRLL